VKSNERYVSCTEFEEELTTEAEVEEGVVVGVVGGVPTGAGVVALASSVGKVGLTSVLLLLLLLLFVVLMPS
jgi:hypothetical protein